MDTTGSPIAVFNEAARVRKGKGKPTVTATVVYADQGDAVFFFAGKRADGSWSVIRYVARISQANLEELCSIMRG